MALTLTEDAKTRISEICKESEFIRISLIGGGCYGFSYKFAVDKTLSQDDVTVKDNHGMVSLAIKETFFKKIPDSTVDFIKNISSSYFVLKSNNFAGTCGCGTSFSLKEEI
jgi:iron-sulfur cluster assembly accessory protein